MSNIHPEIKSEILAIDRLISVENMGSSRYPELFVALAAQRDFLADRPQMLAYNTAKSVRRLMRDEGVEVVESVLESFMLGERVNGKTSLEGSDWIIFASQYKALLENDAQYSRMIKSVEVVLGLEMMKIMRNIFPHFDHVKPLAEKVSINQVNWPARPLQAPVAWSKEKMASFHGEQMRPAIKLLRKKMPGESRVMHPAVAEAIEAGVEHPPKVDGAVLGYEKAYLDLMALIPSEI